MAGQRRNMQGAEARRPGPSLGEGGRHGEGRMEAAGRGQEGAEEMAFAEAEKVTASGMGCRVANVNTDVGRGRDSGQGGREASLVFQMPETLAAPARISQTHSPFGKTVVSSQSLKALDGA